MASRGSRPLAGAHLNLAAASVLGMVCQGSSGWYRMGLWEKSAPFALAMACCSDWGEAAGTDGRGAPRAGSVARKASGFLETPARYSATNSSIRAAIALKSFPELNRTSTLPVTVLDDTSTTASWLDSPTIRWSFSNEQP